MKWHWRVYWFGPRCWLPRAWEFTEYNAWLDFGCIVLSGQRRQAK